MNCKPGDLAWVVGANPPYNGRLVEVMYATPYGDYTLPDGAPARSDTDEPSWVVRFIGGQVPAPLLGGRWRMTFYGSGRDRFLRPIRGNPDDEIELASESEDAL